MTADKVQHWFRPVYGLKANNEIVALRLNEQGKLEGIDELITAVGGAIDEEATGGSTTTLIDTKKNWEADMWKGSILDVTVAGDRYFRKITTNTNDTLTFDSLGDAVSDGDDYKLIPWSDAVEVTESVLQDANETLQSIIDAVTDIGDDQRSLFDVDTGLENINQGINRILEYVDYSGNFVGEFEVTNGAGATTNIELTLTPDDPYGGEVPQGELFEIGVSDGDDIYTVAQAIADAVDASDDWNADKITGEPFVIIEHVNKWDYEVAFDDKTTGVTLDYNISSSTIMSELQEIKEGVNREFYEWSYIETSGENAAASIIVNGVANRAHIITGFEVVIRGGEAGADMVIEVKDDTAAVYKTVIGEGAPSGERVGIVFNKGIIIESGNDVSLEVPAGGVGVITELNLVGFTK